MAKATFDLTYDVPPGNMWVVPLHAFPAVLLSLGVNPEKVLRQVNLTPAYLAQPDNVISHAIVGELFNLGAQETGCEHF
jgi:hypothetical protein